MAITNLAGDVAEPLKTRLLLKASETLQLVKYKEDEMDLLALMAVSSSRPERAEMLNRALTFARTMEDVRARAYALATIALHMSSAARDDVLAEAVGSALNISDNADRGDALISLAPFLNEPHKGDVLRNTLIAVRPPGNIIRRVQLLVDLVPLVPDSMVPELLEIAETLSHAGDRIRVLRSLSDRLTWPDSNNLYKFWHGTLRLLGNVCRSDLLAIMDALVPVMERLDGQRALARAASSIREVGRWWP